jgi:hypothetical protein
MFATDRGARAFCEMAGKNNKGTRLDQARGDKGGPVVVPVVSMKDTGFGSAQHSRKGKNLPGAKSREGVKGESLIFRRKGRVDWASDLNRPT